MPELPDLVAFKRYFEATSLHQKIVEVSIESQRVLENTPLPSLKRGLTGREFETSRRHGKWLFAGLNTGEWLVLHFGMTGSLKYFQDLDDEPDYDQLLLSFENGYHLAYLSQRKLGEIRMIEDPEAFIRSKDLGPDVLELDQDEFRSLLSGRRGMIKSALMDQELMAGIGNVYSDEVLYQLGIHPRTKTGNLSERDLTNLYQILQDVLDAVIDRKAEPEQFPSDYLTPRRKLGAECPRCGEEIDRVKVAGRSAYYCPACQELSGD